MINKRPGCRLPTRPQKELRAALPDVDKHQQAGIGTSGIVDGGSLVTPREAAQVLAVTEKVLERWRSTADGPHFVKLSRKTIRYRQADIQAFVAGSVRKSTAA